MIDGVTGITAPCRDKNKKTHPLFKPLRIDEHRKISLAFQTLIKDQKQKNKLYFQTTCRSKKYSFFRFDYVIKVSMADHGSKTKRIDAIF